MSDYPPLLPPPIVSPPLFPFFSFQHQPRAVSEKDDEDLTAVMVTAEKENTEVAGDDDPDEIDE